MAESDPKHPFGLSTDDELAEALRARALQLGTSASKLALRAWMAS